MIFGNLFKSKGKTFKTVGVPKYHEMEKHVPYVDIFDNYLIDVYGCLHAFYNIEAPSSDVASVDLLTDIQNQITTIIDGLPEYICQVQFIYATAGNYNDTIIQHGQMESSFPLATSLRKERAQLLLKDSKNRKLIKSHTILVLSCLPRASGVNDKLLEQFKKVGTANAKLKVHAITKTECMESINSIKTAQSVVEDCFRRVSINIKQMQATEIANYFYTIFNQEMSQDWGIPLDYDYDSMPFNDAWIREDVSLKYNQMKIGSYSHGFVSMNIKPQESSPRMIERITTDLGFSDVRVTVSVRRTDKSFETSELIGQRNRAMRRMGEPLDLLERIKNPNKKEDIRTAEYNVEVKTEIEQANELLKEMQTGKEFLAIMQLVVHFWAKDEKSFAQRREVITARMSDMNKAKGVPETVGTYSIFKSCLPGSMEPLERWVKVKGRMAADLIPMHRGFECNEHPTALFRNSTNGLLSFDLFEQGKSSAPLSFVSGGSGGGKSFLINLLLLQHIVGNPQIIILDVGGSYKSLVEMLGGKMIEFSIDKPFCFNPMQIYGGTKNVVPDGATRARMNRAVEAMATMDTDPNGTLPRHLYRIIDNCVEQAFTMAESKGKTFIRLSDLMTHLNAFAEEKIEGHPNPKKDLEERLKPFIEGGVYGKWFDGATSIDLQTRVVCFDLKGIKKEKRLCAALVPMIVNYIYDLVMRDRTEKKLLVFDEMWDYIANETMATFFIEAWKTFRKENSAIMGVTQNLEVDVIKNEKIGGAIMQNTDTWFLLNQGTKKQNDAVSEALTLTEGQTEILNSLRSEDKIGEDGIPESYRECLMIRSKSNPIAPTGRLRVQATPKERWIATSAPAETAKRAETIKSMDGDVVKAIEYLAKTYPGGLNIKKI